MNKGNAGVSGNVGKKRPWRRNLAVLVLGLLTSGFGRHVTATELKVIAPNAVKEAVSTIAMQFEKRSGVRVTLAWGGSEAIAKRVSSGEVFDVTINTAQGVDRLISDGKLAVGSRTDFSRSGIAAAARPGVARPDISSVDALRATLLTVDSIAISSGASGRYLEQLFQRLGVAEQVKPKVRQPASGAQIGELISRGEATLGFQQVTELRHVEGVVYLGTLPAEVQHYTVWSAGLRAGASTTQTALDFLRALTAQEAEPIIRNTGMEPI